MRRQTTNHLFSSAKAPAMPPFKRIREKVAASKRILAAFGKDRRGVAALEFALIAPVMIMLLLGSIEITNGFDVNKKLARAGAMVGDLVTQQQSITKEKIADIMEIGTSILLPYWRDLPTITITSINVDGNGIATVAWSQRKQGQTISTPYTKGSTITIDPNLKIPTSNFVRVETSIAYIPLVAWTMKDTVNTSKGTSGPGIVMGKMIYGRIRQGADAVACTNC